MVKEFIGVILLVLLVVDFAEPIQFIKRVLKLDHKAEPKKEWHKMLNQLFNCAQCLGFWAGIIVYQDIYMAAIMSFSCEISYRIFDKLYNGVL